MDTIEKVYSEERAYRRAVGIEPVKMVSNLHNLAKSLFASVRPEHELEQRCWDGAVKYRGSKIAMGGMSLTPIYDEYMNDSVQVLYRGGPSHEPLPEVEFHAPDTLEDRVQQIVSEKLGSDFNEKVGKAEDQLASKVDYIKHMTKENLIHHLINTGTTHSKSAMRKMTKQHLQDIAIVRVAIIPSDDEG